MKISSNVSIGKMSFIWFLLNILKHRIFRPMTGFVQMDADTWFYIYVYKYIAHYIVRDIPVVSILELWRGSIVTYAYNIFVLTRANTAIMTIHREFKSV